jgi:hypothetical protein
MTYENNPFELGLERLVDLDVDCIARDALRRIKERGVSRRIVGVEIDGDRLPTLNFVKWPVTVRGDRVGKVTSARGVQKPCRPSADSVDSSTRSGAFRFVGRSGSIRRDRLRAAGQANRAGLTSTRRIWYLRARVNHK